MPQAAVVSLTSAFDYPPLNGAVNPADGQLYIAGFQIIGWGTTATRMAGLGRVRYTGAPVTVPRQITPLREGVLLRFDIALDPVSRRRRRQLPGRVLGLQADIPIRFTNYKADGTTGIDALVPSRAYVSADGRGVFVAIPDMRPVMQLKVGWKVRARDGRAVEGRPTRRRTRSSRSTRARKALATSSST